MSRIVLDSELMSLSSMLAEFDLSFMGQRACSLARELRDIIDEHLDCLFSFNDFRYNDDFSD